MIEHSRQVGPLRVAEELLSVESRHLDDVGHDVRDGGARSVITGSKLEVLRVPVIISDPIFVMDGLGRQEFPTEVLFHNVSVLENVFTGRFAIFSRDAEANISVSSGRSCNLLIRVILLVLFAAKCAAAFGAAKTTVLSFVQRAVRSALNRDIGRAFNAGNFESSLSVAFPTGGATGDRAVKRISTKFLSVGSQRPGVFRKERSAPSAIERFSYAISIAGVFSKMRLGANLITEFLGTVLTIFNVNVRAALLALDRFLFDEIWHGFLRVVAVKYAYFESNSSASPFKVGA